MKEVHLIPDHKNVIEGRHDQDQDNVRDHSDDKAIGVAIKFE